MRIHPVSTQRYARDLLWSCRETYWPHLMQDQCAIRHAVEAACRTAGWDFHLYVTAVAFDAPWLLHDAR